VVLPIRPITSVTPMSSSGSSGLKSLSNSSNHYSGMAVPELKKRTSTEGISVAEVKHLYCTITSLAVSVAAIHSVHIGIST
jgi:hypothetical protein